MQKLKTSIYLALLLAVLSSFVFVAYFVHIDDYTDYELGRFLPYFIQYNMSSFFLWGFLAAVVFGLIWLVFDRIEGLFLAGAFVLIIFVPAVFYINRNFLPGIREPESLIGNGILGLAALALTLFLFKKVTRNSHFLKRLYSNTIFVIFLLILVGVNLFYYLRPAHTRLQKSPTQYNEQFLNLFDVAEFTDGSDKNSNALDLTRKVFFDHFEQKTDSVIAEVKERLYRLYPEGDTTRVINWADEVIDREFTLWDVKKKLAEKIDWYYNPTHDDIWLYALNEFEWMWYFIASYIMTGDEKYAAEFDEIMRSFFDQISLASWKNEKDPVWRLIGAGLRLSDSWVDAFYVFLRSPNVSDEVRIKMLAYIHDQAQFLYTFRSPHWNHLIQESYGLMKAGIMFPEFKMAQEWLDMSLFRLERSVTIDVYPDGGYTEVSTFYHRYVIRLFEMIVNYAERHHVRFSEKFYRQFENMYQFMMYTTWPDGRMPAVNDGFHAKILRKLFHYPAEKFDRSDFRYFATDGKKGEKPERTSIAFPYSGLYVMRSDWTENARYSIFDGGLFGSAHGHEDRMNFEIFAFGRPFIVESGTYTYVYNDWHRYFESSFSHNTVIVDGRSQLQQARGEAAWVTSPHEKLPNQWFSNDEVDYVESTYDGGYGNVKEDIIYDVSHARRFIFVKPDYWILWDVVRSASAYQVDQLFHFAPMPLQVQDDLRVETQNDSGPQVSLLPLLADDLNVKIVSGETDPIQGWYSPRYGEKEPAPVVIYSVEPVKETAFLNILYPDLSGLREVSASYIEVRVDDQRVGSDTAVAMRVKRPQGSDYLMLAPGIAGTKSFLEFKTDAEVFLVREDSTRNRQIFSFSIGDKN